MARTSRFAPEVRDPTVAPNRPAPVATLALAGVLVLATVLRLLVWANHRGAPWFEEDVPLAWAWKLWGFTGGRFDWNPHNALWPHLSVYVYFVVQAIQYAFGRLTGTFAGPADFRAAVLLDPHLLRGGAMLAAIGFGLATVAASARLTQRLAGPWAAAAVALALAVDPLFLRYSLAISPDMLLTLCTVLGLLAAYDVAARGRLRDSLAGGLWLGLGVACKYSPILLAVPLVLAHARRPNGRRWWVILDGRLWLAAAVSVAAFTLTSPFTLVDLAGRWSQFRVGADVLVHAPPGAVHHFAAAEFLAHTLPNDLGWPLYALLTVAAGVTLVLGSPGARLVLAFALANLVVFGLVPTAFERYLMPAYPPLLALAAVVVGQGLAHAPLRPVLALLLVLALAGLAGASVAAVRADLEPDTRALAHEWFVAHAPDRATVLLELLGPELPDRSARSALLSAPGLSPRWHERLTAGPAYYVSFQPLSFPAPELSTPFYVPTRCSGFDFVVASSGVSGRYLAQPKRFPVQCDFYAAMERFTEQSYRTPAGDWTGPWITVFRTAAAGRDSMQVWWAARAPAFDSILRAGVSEFEAAQFAQRARVLQAGNHHAAALEAWRIAVAWPGAPTDWWYGYGVCAALTGDLAAARTGTRTAFTRSPSLTAAGLLWAQVEQRLGNGATSAQLVDELARRSDLSPHDRAILAALRAGAFR